MSHLISRILLTILMLPLAAIAYTVVFVVGNQVTRGGGYRYLNDESPMFFLTGAIVWGLIAGYWLLLWGRGVKWTGRRIHLTWLAALVSGLGALVTADVLGPGVLGVLVLSVLVLGVLVLDVLGGQLVRGEVVVLIHRDRDVGIPGFTP